MSRIDEALRRGGKSVGQPDTFNVPSVRALDWFAPGNDAPAREAETAVAVAPPVDRPAPTAPAPTPIATSSMLRPTASTFAEGGNDAIGASGFREKLIVGDRMGPVAVEQYRRVAALLHNAQREHGTKVVMVASAVPGEGKTLTAVNLALTLSQSYHRKVVLIDADLRRPTVHQLLGVHNNFGLTSVLKSEEDKKIRPHRASEFLSVVPAGVPDPDPMSGLTSDRMRRVIADAASQFDWVIIDTPPVALLPDANLLAAFVDAAILVIGAGLTPLAAIQKAVEAIGRERVLGSSVESNSTTGTVLLARRALTIDDPDAGDELGARTAAFVPLIHRSDALGVLVVAATLIGEVRLFI
jgi:capsular exopolysaccharide synthesis family protein